MFIGTIKLELTLHTNCKLLDVVLYEFVDKYNLEVITVIFKEGQKKALFTKHRVDGEYDTNDVTICFSFKGYLAVILETLGDKLEFDYMYNDLESICKKYFVLKQ